MASIERAISYKDLSPSTRLNKREKKAEEKTNEILKRLNYGQVIADTCDKRSWKKEIRKLKKIETTETSSHFHIGIHVHRLRNRT